MFATAAYPNVQLVQLVGPQPSQQVLMMPNVVLPQVVGQQIPQQQMLTQLVMPQQIVPQGTHTIAYERALSQAVPGPKAPTSLPMEDDLPFPADLEMPPLVEESDQPHSSNAALRVSGRTKRSALAGAIAKRLRSKFFVAVEAMGAESVATTTTALALAKMFISMAGLSLLVQVESISAPPREPAGPQDQEHPGLRYVVRAWKAKDGSGFANFDTKHFGVTLSVPRENTVAKVAGMIAKLMRGAGSQGSTVALRPEPCAASLNVTSKAIALARAMLNGDGYDIYCRPCFENEQQRGATETEQQIVIALYLTRKQAAASPTEP